MPTYIYHCSACTHQFEEMQKISAAPLIQCPHCHKETLKRKPAGGVGLNFVGSGFYVNDYAASPTGGSCCPCGKAAKSEGGCKA